MRKLRLPLLSVTLAVTLSSLAPTFDFSSAAQTRAPLVISEFRLRGPNGPQDEFVEIYNHSDADYVVTSADGTGFALVASDGFERFRIPETTVIPARGHFLGVNAAGYSLAAYPAGAFTTATGDAAFTDDIPDNAGLALFDSADPADFDAGHRLDAVGSTDEPDPLYREGAGYPALNRFNVDHSVLRNPSGGLPRDTDNNAADFRYVDTNGTTLCHQPPFNCQQLGQPGPENLSGPVRGTLWPSLTRSLLDPSAGLSAPNREFDLAPDPEDPNDTHGKLTLRRTFTNNSEENIVRLRLRFVELSTFPSPVGTADLRPDTSPSAEVTLRDGSTVNVSGTTLDGADPEGDGSQAPNGGGVNSALSVPGVTLFSPLRPGDSVHVQIRFGIQQPGAYRVAVVVETLPYTSSDVWLVEGHTDSAADREPGVDTTPPVINIMWPAGTFLLNEGVRAIYTCADAESAVTACAGPVASGSPVDTSSVGTKSFDVTASDAAGNASTSSLSYNVTYDVGLSYDWSRFVNQSAPVKLKIQLRDARGMNFSSPSVAVTALRVTPLNQPGVTVRGEPGAFAFDPTIEGWRGATAGGYTYKLDPAGLAPGLCYQLVFTVAGDPLPHIAPFCVGEPPGRGGGRGR